MASAAKKVWRDSASVILLARDRFAAARKAKFDYEVLMLRRSGKSKFMPNTFVFPGGVISNTDFDKSWRDVFSLFGNGRSADEVVVGESEGIRRPLLMRPRDGDDCDGRMPRDVAFRLCAIRETFEESGVFLGGALPERDVDEWRHRVHDDPGQLLRMCHHFEVCPDIWSLYEWACWLTPLFRGDPGQRRFDTIFYAAFLDDGKPEYSGQHDDKEMTAMQWSDPELMLLQHWDNALVLAPPQVYELTRLRAANEMSDLKMFGEKLKSVGVSTWLPVFFPCTDGIISALPGDELYPSEPDFTGERNEAPSSMLQDMSIEEANVRYPRSNRNLLFRTPSVTNKTAMGICGDNPLNSVLQNGNYVVKL